jgi:N-acetylmuramoyl-L-alanine amidase
MRRPGATSLVAGSLAALTLGTMLILNPPPLVRHPPSPAASGPRTRTRKDASGTAGGTTSDVDGSAGQAIDPALFGPGACLAFAPTSDTSDTSDPSNTSNTSNTSRDRHETVFLDAGHGGIDPGAVGSTESGQTVDEAPVNLAIELDTMAILRAQGYRVVVSRTQNTTVTRLTPADTTGGLLTVQGALADVAARDVCANLGGADVLVGIYMDSGDPWNAGSVTGYDADRPFSAANLRLATLLQDDVLGALNAQGYGIPDEGVLPDTVLGSALTGAAVAYGHLVLLGPAQAGYFETPSQMPGALIEPLFLTDPFEGSIAASAHGQQVIAGALAEAVGQYFSQPAPAAAAAYPESNSRLF